MKFTPFEGKAMVLGLFGVLIRTFADFRYTGRLDGVAETGRRIHGMDPLQLDEAGLVAVGLVTARAADAAGCATRPA
ncbi:hypothetical protein [Nonomuraea sp. SBT364]|uniref:hypothetical protein n=1 Tax=Nonomuraea sp. SBT364 TaxID=1580530 RepID=UPI0018CFB227|nr:hypothetical protein [Nonomuraea sp. SBT364]